MSLLIERGCRTILAVAVIAGLLIMLNVVSAYTERIAAQNEPGNELLYLPDRQLLHIAALGDDMTAADLMWLRGVFYVAAQGFEEKQEESYKHWFIRQAASAQSDTIDFWHYDFRQHPVIQHMLLWNLGSEDARELSRLLDNVTRLDSLFATPYVQGGLNLALMAGRPEEALKLLDRGVQAMPDRWEMPYYRGFIKLFFLNDKAGALDDISLAAQKPGVLPVVVDLAAALKMGMGKRDLALDFLRSLYDLTNDQTLKKNIGDLLARYEALDNPKS